MYTYSLIEDGYYDDFDSEGEFDTIEALVEQARKSLLDCYGEGFEYAPIRIGTFEEVEPYVNVNDVVERLADILLTDSFEDAEYYFYEALEGDAGKRAYEGLGRSLDKAVRDWVSENGMGSYFRPIVNVQEFEIAENPEEQDPIEYREERRDDVRWANLPPLPREGTGNMTIYRAMEILKRGLVSSYRKFCEGEGRQREWDFCLFFAKDLKAKELVTFEETYYEFSEDGTRMLKDALSDFRAWYFKFLRDNGIDSTVYVPHNHSDELYVNYSVSTHGLSLSYSLANTEVIDYDWDEEPYASGLDIGVEISGWNGEHMDLDEVTKRVWDVYNRIDDMFDDAFGPLLEDF